MRPFLAALLWEAAQWLHFDTVLDKSMELKRHGEDRLWPPNQSVDDRPLR